MQCASLSYPEAAKFPKLPMSAGLLHAARALASTIGWLRHNALQLADTVGEPRFFV
jgi:hypothetical protein